MPKSTFFNLPAERREEIIEKAVDYYIRVPYEQISLRSLTEHLGMPMGTFYRYFTDKDELFLYLCDILDEEYERKDDFILNPPFERPSQDHNPQRLTRFFDAFRAAPEDIQRRFMFDVFTSKGVEMHKKELMRLKYKGLLREDVDIDLIAFLYSTVMYNLNMYFTRMDIEDEELRWEIRKYLFYSFFKHGIMKPDNEG